MVDWKFYIDSPQQRALDLCGGSLTEGNGYSSLAPGFAGGWGNGYSYDYGAEDGDGYGFGYGAGYGYGDRHEGCRRDGGSAREW